MQENTTICVCGAGTMGRGIAQVAAGAGFRVILFEINGEALQKAKNILEQDLQKLTDKQKLTLVEKENLLQHIFFTSHPEFCVADVVIEAIVEKFEEKISLFQRLTSINSENTIFASNTSSLSITRMAGGLRHPQQLVGLHFFNPAPLMKLVEVVTTPYVLPAVVHRIILMAQQMGKTPVVCADSPGFIVNRVARPYYLESLKLAEENKADFATIDTLLEAQGFKMGPFRLMDLIGNDINYTVSCSVYEQLNGPERLKPSPLQKEKVERNELGKKSGKGYYTYD